MAFREPNQSNMAQEIITLEDLQKIPAAVIGRSKGISPAIKSFWESMAESSEVRKVLGISHVTNLYVPYQKIRGTIFYNKF
jgi:hypothetical protein